VVSTISKEQIADLPVEQFNGHIIVAQNEKEVNRAVWHLSGYDKIGFDTETRPTFHKGHSHKTALMQLSTDDACFLLRLNLVGFTEPLVKLLTNPQIKKIGLSLRDDFLVMRKSSSFIPAGFVDLQTVVKNFGIEDISLQRIYAILFGKRISKNQRLTNWEAQVLTEKQQMYAALDAWACLKIYNELEQICNSTEKKQHGGL
jgi:ribonuclease D